MLNVTGAVEYSIYSMRSRLMNGTTVTIVRCDMRGYVERMEWLQQFQEEEVTYEQVIESYEEE